MSKQLTTYLKGIAIVLMVMHHSLTNPSWYVEGISNSYLYPYTDLLNRFGGFAVVPMFLFLTGWGYYFHEDKSLAYSVKKIVTFLVDYWMVLFGIAALAYGFCDYKLTAVGLLQEMFSINNELILFSWYVFLYIEIMLFLPYFSKYIACYDLKKTILIVLAMLAVMKIATLLIAYLFTRESFLYTAVNRYFFRNISIVVAGYLCAKYNVLDRLTEHLKTGGGTWRNYLLIVGCLIFYNFVRMFGTINTGLFLCPIFIAALAALNINYAAVKNKIMLILGRYSMNTWFIHALFFSESTRYVFQKYGFWLHDPILSYLWILAVSTCLSIPVTKLQNVVNAKISSIFK